MSDTVFAGLPRFDLDSGSTRPPTGWMKSLEAGTPSVPPELTEPPEPEIQKLFEEPIVEETPPSLDLTHIEASLATLCGRIDRIERDAQTQALQTVKAIAEKLFPKLSRAFLAEEIGRSLPKMIPFSAAIVEIRAEAGLADKLRELVDQTPTLAHRCTVIPTAAEGQGNVAVSWQTGGLSFEFDGLLQACLSHLTLTQSGS